MNENNSHYTILANLFTFPGADFSTQVAQAMELMDAYYPKAAQKLDTFVKGMPQSQLDQQELFTRTFDVQAITTLDIGYVMFGDDYKRAELLSNLSREHREAGINCGIELADHLPNLLRLLALMEDQALVQELVEEILVPGLMLMIREFDSDRIVKKNAHYKKHFKTIIDAAQGSELTIYCQALEALLEILRQDFEVSEMISKLQDWSSRPQSVAFLESISKEMEIEDVANPTNSGRDS